MKRYDAQPLLRGRTEEGKMVRRAYGDDSGMCKFRYKYAYPGDDRTARAVTTFISKDNLIVEYLE